MRSVKYNNGICPDLPSVLLKYFLWCSSNFIKTLISAVAVNRYLNFETLNQDLKSWFQMCASCAKYNPIFIPSLPNILH